VIGRNPVYESTAEVLVTPVLVDETAFIGLPLVRESSDPTRTTQTAVEMIDSAQAARATARRVGGGATRESVEEAVDVQPRGQSNIVVVSATASSPRAAAQMAGAFVAAGLANRDAALRTAIETRLRSLRRDTTRAGAAQVRLLRELRQTGDPTLSLLQPALVPTRTAGPPSRLVVAAALLAGLLLGGAAAALLDFSRPRRRVPANGQATGRDGGGAPHQARGRDVHAHESHSGAPSGPR
jgi:uncharacterized protein involved in exopolysaccharide biosynthesis